MLETILAISGKPGLYRLLSRGNRNLIVESLDSQKKRLPIFGVDKVVSLADIAMYTDEEEVPLRSVLKSILSHTEGKKVEIDIKKTSKQELSDFLSTVLPNYDRDRVFPNDIKKLIQWFNILVENGVTDFDSALMETEGDNVDDRLKQE